LKISPDGKLLHVFEIAAGDGTTNVAFSEGEKELYVAVLKDPKDSEAKGSIVKIAIVPSRPYFINVKGHAIFFLGLRFSFKFFPTIDGKLLSRQNSLRFANNTEK